MSQRIVVPVDGSPRSLAAVRFGSAIAADRHAGLEAVTVVGEHVDAASERDRLVAQLDGLGELAATPSAVVLTGDRVAETLARYVTDTPATIAMSSTGHGRSAAMLGSVAEDLLAAGSGPVFVIGPHATDVAVVAPDVVVPVDGSRLSESALDLAASWRSGHDLRTWVVTVLATSAGGQPDVDRFESSYVARTARELQRRVDHPVEYEVLHGGSPARAIVDYAAGIGAGLIVMSTHGRTGLRRVVLGSVAADVVRSATCPVLLQRPA